MSDDSPEILPHEHAGRRWLAIGTGAPYEAYPDLATARTHPRSVVTLESEREGFLVVYPVELVRADDEGLNRLLADILEILTYWTPERLRARRRFANGGVYYEPARLVKRDYDRRVLRDYSNHEDEEACREREEFYRSYSLDGLLINPTLEQLHLRGVIEDVLQGEAPNIDPAVMLHHRQLVEWFAAAERGDVESVRRLLDQGMPVDVRNYFQVTTLHVAACGGFLELIRLLLDAGADPNATAGRAPTPVTAAVKRFVRPSREEGQGDRRPLDMLLAAGGRFGLREAVVLGDLDLARRLCDEDPSIDVSDDALFYFHDTYLMTAATFGHVEMVRFLLDRGADVERTDDLGRTALINAAEKGRLDIVDLLLERGADVDHDDWSDFTPLGAAAVYGHDEVVVRLLNLGASRSILDAIHLNDESLVARLTSEGVAPDHVYYGEPSPIRFAIMRGRLAIVAMLLDAGPVENVSRSRLPHRSLVAEAAATGRLDVVRVLVDHGLDPREVGGDGLTSLEWAEREGHAEVADYLHRQG